MSAPRNKPHFILTNTANTIVVDYESDGTITVGTYPGVSSTYKSWTLWHRPADGLNNTVFAVTLTGQHKGHHTFRLYYTPKGRFKILNHSAGSHYLPKEVRKWVRSEHKTLYVKARLAGWVGLKGRN